MNTKSQTRQRGSPPTPLHTKPAVGANRRRTVNTRSSTDSPVVLTAAELMDILDSKGPSNRDISEFSNYADLVMLAREIYRERGVEAARSWWNALLRAGSIPAALREAMDELQEELEAESEVPAAGEVEQEGTSTKPTDDELRDEWLDAHPDTAFGLGSWRRYESGRWPEVEDHLVKREIERTIEGAKDQGIRPTVSRLRSVHELAKVHTFVPASEWDTDPDILVCANGTLHIPTQELRAHSKSDYATGAVPYDFDPGEDCPTFRYVLASTVPEAAGFIQEFAGLSLTVDTSYEMALWFYGLPGGGKSTLILGLQAMLGTRCGLLGIANIERSRFALSGIVGKTLVVSTEQPAGYIQSTNLINTIISGEPITVERKYHDPVDVIPRCKIVWSMNELPQVSSTTDGLFRRVKVVQFPIIPPNDRDPSVKQLVGDEGPGILNWALEGLGRLRERGCFEIPDCVKEATEEFRISNDKAALFLADECELDEEASVRASVLYGRYREWCDNNGRRAESSTKMAAEWQRLDLERDRDSQGTFYRGVRLRKVGEV